MAGFYLILGKADEDRILGAEKAITNFNDEYSEIITEEHFTCICKSINDKKLLGSAIDPVSGVRAIISGRIHLSEQQWKEAESLDAFEGGLASKLMIKEYLNDGIKSIYELIGPALIIIWNPESDKIEIITDHFGYYPAFAYRNDKNKIKIVSSSPDAIAEDKNAKVTRDELSLVEFLSGWRITPPHTYYNEIKYLGAAKHFTISSNNTGYTEEEYWKPFENGFYDDFDIASRELEAALRDSIGKITLPRLGPIVNFTSGGMDSRVVLYTANDHHRLIGFNIYDKPNLEASVAKQLCKECNVRYYGFERDMDYYPRLMKDIVTINNGMNSIDDQHYLGTRDVINALGAKTVISGCSTDWLFKGYGLEKKYKQFFGKNLPISDLMKNRVNAFLPNYPNNVPNEYQDQINERLKNWFGNTPEYFKTDKDWLLVEDKRIRPALYAPSISGPSMYRIFPYDTFLASSKIADVFGKMPAKWKINAVIWSATVSRIGGKAGKVIDVNSGSRMGIGIMRRLFDFGTGWIKRHILIKNRNVEDQLETDYSWPNYGWYIKHSETINEFWFNADETEKNILNKYLGYNPWKYSLDYWSNRHNDFFRILTLLLWFENKK